jgi:hypothetical protein
MTKKLPGVIAGLVAAGAAAAPAAAGPTVTVRVEGQNGTLLERTAVTLPDAPGAVCPAGTAGAALDVATGGNWNREPFVNTILGESHTFASSDYWAEWLDDGRGGGYRRGAGLCDDRLDTGAELLMLVDMPPYSEGSTTEVPLDLEGVPAAVQAGRAFTVTVVGYTTDTQYGDIGDGDRTPVGGASVQGGGVAATTDADGRATLALPQPGAVVLKASKAGSVVSAGEHVTVSAEPVPAPAVSDAPGAAARDTTAPRPALTGLRTGRRFAHGGGPRLIAGTVAADASGLAAVKLSLTRERGGKSWYFSGRSERFRRQPRGRSVFFGVGDRQRWSYLLPRRLGPGRYTVRVAAIDKAGNRAETKVVIRVR